MRHRLLLRGHRPASTCIDLEHINPALRAAQPGGQARADGPGACGAGHAGDRCTGLRGCGAIPPAHHRHRRLVLPALPPGAVAYGAVAAAAACRLDAADGRMQRTTSSSVGYITVHRPVRCRQTSGGADRAHPCDHAAGARFAKRRWPDRQGHARASPSASRRLAMHNPRIGHPSSA